MKEIRPVDSQKNGNDYRDITMLTSLFGIVGLYVL